MPRKSRIDAPGALHHITAYGTGSDAIFRGDADRDGFIERLAAILTETRTPCLAWALLENHFHLLLKTGNVPIATVMRRLLAGYAGAFNRRHQRQGSVFRNRYKSILCQEDAYPTELVRCNRAGSGSKANTFACAKATSTMGNFLSHGANRGRADLPQKGMQRRMQKPTIVGPRALLRIGCAGKPWRLDSSSAAHHKYKNFQIVTC